MPRASNVQNVRPLKFVSCSLPLDSPHRDLRPKVESALDGLLARHVLRDLVPVAGRSLGMAQIRLDKPLFLLNRGRLAMTKADIVNAIAAETGLTKTDIAEVVEGFLASVIKVLSRGEHIEIRGFGTFKTVQRAPRIARNPRKDEVIRIPARNLPVFQPSKELRSLVEKNLPIKESDQGI